MKSTECNRHRVLIFWSFTFQHKPKVGQNSNENSRSNLKNLLAKWIMKENRYNRSFIWSIKPTIFVFYLVMFTSFVVSLTMLVKGKITTHCMSVIQVLVDYVSFLCLGFTKYIIFLSTKLSCYVVEPQWNPPKTATPSVFFLLRISKILFQTRVLSLLQLFQQSIILF